jgi:hypothetical protein
MKGCVLVDNKIINYCNETESIYGVLELFKKEFFESYNALNTKEKKVVLKSTPYSYRLWYHSALIDDTSLSAANFLNLQIKDKFNEDCTIVPALTPVYNRKALKDFRFEFKIFTIDDHPVLKDIIILLESSLPDIGTDENGLILEEERVTFINNLTFKEIYYVTFLTNIAYELKLLKRQPAIGVYRAAPNKVAVSSFFKLSNEEQFEKIVDTAIKVASRQLCHIFIPDDKAFTVNVLKNLLKDGLDLTVWLDNIMNKYNLNFDAEELEGIDINTIDTMMDDELPKESLMALGMRMELAFHMDMCLITPLAYYLQLIQPIYSENYDFESYFYDLYEAEITGIPQIRLYFIMPQGFDLTPLGKNYFINGKTPPHEFQSLLGEIDFNMAYEEILKYNSEEAAFDEVFSEDDMLDFMENLLSLPLPSENKTKALLTSISPDQEIVTEKSSVYLFKIKKAANKRAFKTFAVKGSQTLDKLAQAIISVFNLDYGHMYAFFMSNKAYDPETKIACPYDFDASKNTESYKFHQLNLYKGQKFMFLYDFGEDIMFELEFIGTEPAVKGVKYPILKETTKK